MPYPSINDLGYESGVVGVKAKNTIIEILEEEGSSCCFIPVEFRLIVF